MSSRLILISSGLLVVLMANASTPQPPKPKDGPLGMKFVPLPKGTFYMGWDGQKGSVKKMEIKEGFEIAVYTVTQGQWQELMGSNPSFFSREGKGKNKIRDVKDDDLKLFPVESVSWHDAQDFLKKLTEREKGKGYVYRLPTQVEWEYACRGGATSEEECSFRFYFDKPTNDLSSKQANFDGNSPFGKADKGPVLGRTTKVGSYQPNKLGLHDMHGNVSQWCADDHFIGDPARAIRGGCWVYVSSSCQAYLHHLQPPTTRSEHIGIRVLRTAVR